MEELYKELWYDESTEQHDILILLEIKEENFVVFGKRDGNTITITRIKNNPIIAK